MHGTWHRAAAAVVLAAAVGFLACSERQAVEPDVSFKKGAPEAAGNNLSFPVIWAEGVTKVLPGTPGMEPLLAGEWWYQWGSNGTDPNVTPASCLPDPDEGDTELNPDGLPLCDDGVPGAVDLIDHVAGVPVADTPLPLARAYLQKDANNTWQAASGTPADYGIAQEDGTLEVHWIDWGDNLESVDWYTKSQVRTEVVLFQDNPDPVTTPWLEYEMRHTSGWGIDEVHGLATDLALTPLLGAGTRATVYSHCARFMIQRLLVERDDAALGDLVWVPGEGWTEADEYEDDLINAPIFNGAVYEGGDGPGYYSAEINVKGRIIYGYTWNVRTLNEGAGDYRLTFSFDQTCGSETVLLNAFFIEGVTDILVPLEVEVLEAEASEEPGGGATAVLLPAVFDEVGNLVGGNLTYMDVRILQRGGGGGGGGSHGGGGGGGGPRH